MKYSYRIIIIIFIYLFVYVNVCMYVYVCLLSSLEIHCQSCDSWFQYVSLKRI